MLGRQSVFVLVCAQGSMACCGRCELQHGMDGTPSPGCFLFFEVTA